MLKKHEERLQLLLERRRKAQSGGGPMYRNLIAWQKATILQTAIHEVTCKFPKEELYGRTSQLRRAAVSVASNLAEGQGRRQPGEVAQFLGNARGSLVEVESQVIGAELQGYISADVSDVLLDSTEEIMRMINALINKTPAPQRRI
jgi:four helix bundle protein